MNEKILFVDDEPNVLAAHERQLRKRYTVETATSGEAGLAALAGRGPFAVIVSDLRMAGLDGVQFLARASERYPESVRILLTGYADIQHAMEAVNQGRLFRFLTKPCPQDTLCGALDAAIAQYRLVTAERELLDKTLRGSLQVLGEVLALANPTAFGRALRAQQLIRDLSEVIEGAKGWEVDVAAVLSQLGCIALPEAVLATANRGAELRPEERRQMETHPGVARDLLKPIPRLDQVVQIIAYQDKPFLAPSRPSLEKCGKEIPLGARLLKIVLDFDALLARGVPRSQAVTHLESRTGEYDPDILTALAMMVRRESAVEIREVTILDLGPGMVLAEDLYSDVGVLLLSKGNPITGALKRRLEVSIIQGRSPKLIRVLVSKN
ncbi:MAG TPA: HD domain-containing phosphohydrolase [Gemmata sp.]|jgi:response regulator RpfG family c-di-GMP phosphodiesterase|nr:HD domain-containing phosphohydrolase [Gemmata sp.]